MNFQVKEISLAPPDWSLCATIRNRIRSGGSAWGRHRGLPITRTTPCISICWTILDVDKAVGAKILYGTVTLLCLGTYGTQRGLNRNALAVLI